MPYIKQEDRKILNKVLNPLMDVLENHFPNEPGALNYVITSLIDTMTLGGIDYSKLNAAIGILECAKLELYRCVAVPYEDQKRELNGDVYK